jgi:hypothetical protein
MVASCARPASARSPATAARKPSTIDRPRVLPSRSAAPQPSGHALKAGLAGEVADALAGDDQFAALAVDMAEHGFGGGDAVQADRGL